MGAPITPSLPTQSKVLRPPRSGIASTFQIGIPVGSTAAHGYASALFDEEAGVQSPCACVRRA